MTATHEFQAGDRFRLSPAWARNVSKSTPQVGDEGVVDSAMNQELIPCRLDNHQDVRWFYSVELEYIPPEPELSPVQKLGVWLANRQYETAVKMSNTVSEPDYLWLQGQIAALDDVLEFLVDLHG